MYLFNPSIFNLLNKHLTIAGPIRGPKHKIKKSVFIATIFPIVSESDFKERLFSIRKDFFKSTHNPWAYRYYESNGLKSDFHDDGEVKGVAGRIIMKHLENYSLVNVLLVVSRFYGGVNLGKGGLICSYSHAAMDLLENVKMVPFKQ